MHVSRALLTRLALIVLAVIVSIAATGALMWRSQEREQSAASAYDIAALELIQAQMHGMGAVTSLRMDALAAGRSGAVTLDLGTAGDTIDDLKAQLAPLAAPEEPVATQAAVLDAALDGWVRAQPQTSDFLEAMTHLDRLGFEICCTGWSAPTSRSSETVGEVQYLAFGLGGLAYLFNDYLVQETLVAGREAVTSEYASYLEGAVGIPRFSSLTTSNLDTLFTFFPTSEQQDPALTDRIDQAMGTDAADTLRDVLEWVDNGGASASTPPPASFDEVIAAIRQVTADQQTVMNDLITDDITDLEATVDRSAPLQEYLLVAAWVGFGAAALLLALQIFGLVKLQHESEIHRHEAQAKLDVVSVVAHELRTPLTAVTGFADYLHSGWNSLSDEEIHGFLELIKSQSDEVMRLVDDLLTVRRLEAGSLDLALQAVNVRELTSSIATAAPAEPGQSVIFDLPDELSVRCDPDRMKQILRNYLDNARKYGGTTVLVTTSSRDGFCRISVRDDGDGVPTEDVERIFAQFDRGSVADRSDTGYGLGLSIVKTLATAMGGDAGYNPGSPRGSEFWVDVPLAPSSADAG